MADKPAALEQAAQRALSQALETLQRQVEEVQSSFAEAKGAVQATAGQDSSERFVNLVTTLVRVQTAGAALTASIEAVLRFVGVSAQWAGTPAAAPAAAAPAPAPAPAEEVPAAEAPVAAEAPAEEVAVEEAPAAVEEPEPAPAEAPAPVAAPEPVDVESLPDDLRKLHKKAARFARVTVQELFMYKKEEVDNGRQNKDLYRRFKEEIDKSKALYDKRFKKIADHNIDYLYDELVRVLAENDASALGDYPYTPGS